MRDKIGYDDLFESNAFKGVEDGIAAMVDGFKELNKEIKSGLSAQKEFFSGFKVQNSEDIKKLNEELEKTNKKLVELEKVEKAVAVGELELAKIRQQNAKAIQEEEKAAQQKLRTDKAASAQRGKELTEYQKQSKALNDLRNSYKELAVAGRENGKVAKGLLQDITKLDTKLKQIDKTVGQNQRNVGNYSSAFEKFGSITNNILGAAGIGLGVGGFVNLAKSVFNTRAEFQKFEAVLTNTLGSKSQAQGALDRITEFASKTPFGVKELTEDFVKLANTGFKPTIEEMTALGDLAASQGKSFDQLTEAIIDAQTGEFERLKEFGVRAKKEGDKVILSFKDQKIAVDNNSESIRKAILGFGELEGVAGGMAAISETLGGKLSNLNDNFDALLNTMGESSEGVFAAALDGLNTLLSGINDYEKRISEINRNLKAEKVELGFFDKLTSSTAIANTELQGFINGIKKAAEARKDFGGGIDLLTKSQGLLADQYSKGIITLDEYNVKSALVRKAIKDLTDSSAAYTKDLTKQNEKINQNTKVTKENTKAKKEQFGTWEEAIKLQQELADEEERRLKFESDQAKKEKERIKNEEDFNAAIELQNEKLAESDAIEAERLAKQKEAREKARKELFDSFNQVIELAEKEVKEKEKIREEALDKEISDREKALDDQRRRVEQGLSSDIATAEKNLKEAEARKAEEEKKKINREKAITFFKLLSANAEKDPNNALEKTLTEMLLADTIAKNLPGFYEGTELVKRDAQGNKFSEGKDGYLFRGDGEERVVKGEHNKMMGDLSNEELAKLAYDYNHKLLPNYVINEPVNTSFAEKAYSAIQLQQLVEQNKELIKAVKNIPGTNINIADGYFSRTDNVNGYKTTTKKPLTRGYDS